MTGRKSSLLIIFLTVFIDLLGFTLIIPIVPFYIQEFVANPDLYGITYGSLIASYSLMQFIFSPIWGRFSDRVGRRPIILFSLFGSAVTNLMFALAGSLWFLFAARILTGICAATVPTAMAYIADITTDEDRAKGMGLVGAAFGLGFVLGPAIGGIMGKNDLSLPLYASAAFSLMAFFLAYIKLAETVDTNQRRSDAYERYKPTNLVRALQHPTLGLLFAIFFLVTLSFSNMTTIFVYFTESQFGYHTHENGFFFALIGIISATIQGGLIGKLARKFGELKLIITATLLIGTSLVLMPLTHNAVTFTLVVVCLSLGIGIHNPSVTSLISRNTSKNEQGQMLGINQSFSALARVIAPLWAGFLYDYFGTHFTLWSAGLLIYVTTGLGIRLRKQHLTQSSSARTIPEAEAEELDPSTLSK